jgi:hypothetical protein
VGQRWITTREWHEGDRQADGTIRRDIASPSASRRGSSPGPHFYVATPFNKTPNEGCRHNKDYTLIDPEEIPTTTSAHALRAQRAAGAVLSWDAQRGRAAADAALPHVHREMVSPNGERTLIPALMPPGPAQVHYGQAGCLSYQPGDGALQRAGLVAAGRLSSSVRWASGHVNVNLIERLPCEVPDAYAPEVIARVLRLNALTTHYADLWAELAPAMRAGDGFTKPDPRLGPWVVRATWSRDVALRRAYARRQALVELDALAALALGVSIDDLALVYRVQFPVLQEYERDTWYDAAGRVVFTVNKGLPGGGPDAGAVGARAGGAEPGAEVEGGFVAPFDRCDREQDMRAAYTAFRARGAGAGGGLRGCAMRTRGSSRTRCPIRSRGPCVRWTPRRKGEGNWS